MKVRLIGTDNQPFPGAVVNWTVTEGVAIAQPPSSVTDVAGEATTALALGFQTGPVQVTASVAGIAPVTFTATSVVVSTFPCQSVTEFDFAFSGTLDAGDGTINGYYLDLLVLTRPAQRSLSLHMLASTLDPWLGFYAGNGALMGMNDDSLLGVAHNAAPVSAAYVLDFGTRDTAATGNYSISIARDPTLAASATWLGAPARPVVVPHEPRQQPPNRRVKLPARVD